MANSFNALIADVNEKLTEMNTVVSDANSAAAAARTAAESVSAETDRVAAAVEEAEQAAQLAEAEAAAWENAVVTAETVDSSSQADVSVTESGGRKMPYISYSELHLLTRGAVFYSEFRIFVLTHSQNHVTLSL